MNKQKITWTKTYMGDWNHYAGESEDYGPYFIEKEDTRSFSVWWGNVDIGNADNVQTAKALATKHANNMMV